MILGVAVLLDAMLIRLVLLPVLLRMTRSRMRGRCRAGSIVSFRTFGSGTREHVRSANAFGVERRELADGRAGLAACRAHAAPEQEPDERDRRS